MKPLERAHVVLVAGKDQGLQLAVHLCRIRVARATFVADVDEARSLCLAGGPDLCLVAIDGCILDAAPLPEIDAPGRATGVPSLLLAAVVTPYLRRMAWRCGYSAAIPAGIAPQMLARRICAALQRRRTARTGCAAIRDPCRHFPPVGRRVRRFSQSKTALTALSTPLLRC